MPSTWKHLLALALGSMMVLAACGDDDTNNNTAKEICNNVKDDDSDGKVDCADSDCTSDEACKVTSPETNCANDVDDDGDGKADCLDTDCSAAANCNGGCATGETACGSDCCTADETCNNGVCEPQGGCGTGETACGSDCCTANETCNNGVCEPAGTCGEGETACGTDCCTANETCNSGVCEPVGTCAQGETACGSDCCTSSETCTNDVCVGSQVEGCTVVSSFGTVELIGNLQTGQSESGDQVMYLEGLLPSTDESTDTLSVELYEGLGVFANGIAVGTYTISGDEAQYATCGLCLRMHADLDPSSGAATAYYMATAGSVTITNIDGTLEATATDLVFTHVDINTQTFESTPNPDGCASGIEDLAVSTPVICEPLNPTACGQGEGCYYNGSGFSCSEAGTVQPGGACGESVGNCIPGAQCIDSLCRTWCDPSATPDTCTAPAVCTQVTQNGEGLCIPEENCSNTSDDDGDGLADCADSDCSAEPDCLAQLCSSAIPMTSASVTGDTNTGTAGLVGDCAGDGNEVIYTLTTGTSTQSGALTITVDSSDFDPVLYVQTTCGDASTELDCADSGADGDSETLTIDYVGGTTLTVVVDSYGDSGTFTLSYTFVPSVCGDSTVAAGELCDDGNTTAGDGCDASCQIESGFVCPTAGQACREITCGDGIIDAPEICDDQNTVATDGCDATCQVESGFVCPTAGQACREITCGDGLVDAPETCDDQNTVATDGCDNCTLVLTESEPNNTSAEANPYTSPFTGNIAAGDEDWVAVTLTDVSSLTAQVADWGDGACAANQIDSKIDLYDSAGTKIGTDDDSGDGYCSMLTNGRLAAGTYYVRVYGYNATTTFNYQLNITIGAAEACTVDANLGTVTVQSSQSQGGTTSSGASVVKGWFDVTADPDTVFFGLFQGYGVFANALAPGQYTISGDETSLATCGLCVLLMGNVDQTSGEAAGYYMATSGTVNLTSVSGNLVGTLSNATFQQVTISGDVSTPVVGGCESAITSMDFNVAITTSKMTATKKQMLKK